MQDSGLDLARINEERKACGMLPLPSDATLNEVLRKWLAMALLLTITVGGYFNTTDVWQGGYVTGATFALTEIGGLTCQGAGVSGNMVKATIEAEHHAGRLPDDLPMSTAVMRALIRLGCTTVTPLPRRGGDA